MAVGIVKRFNSERGFGFIVPEGDNPEGDVFVHQNNINMKGFRCLYADEKVEFDLEEASDGFKALNVRVLEESPERNRPRPPQGYNSNYRNPNSHRNNRGVRRNHHGHGAYDQAKLGRMMDKLLEILSDDGSDVDPILTREEVIEILKS